MDITEKQLDVLREFGHGRPWIMDDRHYGDIAWGLAFDGYLTAAPPPSTRAWVITDKGRAALEAARAAGRNADPSRRWNR